MNALEASASKPLDGGPSFSFANWIYRASFTIVWNSLAAWTPSPFRRWRRFILCLFGANLDRTAIVYSSVRVWDPRNLTMLADATLGPRVNCYCMAPITLQKYAVVSQGAHLCAGTHDVDDPHFQLFAQPIVIEERAWIAAEAFVGPGVTVAVGAVLGARAVTFSDLASWTIYVGNPARPIRFRKRLPTSASAL